MNRSGKVKEIGHIITFFAGVAKLQGLPHAFLHEVLLDENHQPLAIVIGFDEQFVDALFFDEKFDFKKPVFRSKQSFSVAVSSKISGRILDGLGRPRDGFGEITGQAMPVFRQAPALIDRGPVSTPLSSGIKLIDAALPLGRGQRELIIGDRKLGKSTLAQDIILNQKQAEPPVRCVYVICGQKQKKLKQALTLFEQHNALAYTTLVAATADDSYAAQYLAPFIGCAIGEYFRDQGEDALVVYDDLSQHAKVYRSISLLLERTPGREAYPGDIFSLHAGLLERAAKLSKERGGGSLSALPIIETQEEDITAFIPTNLISITDGQIYLERGLFQKGFLPAVNVGLSVSRIGSQAQPKILQEVAGGIRLALAQHKELQKLTQLESVISQTAQKKIHRGELTLELLKQEKHTNITWPEQVVLFYAVEQGYFDDMKKEYWREFENRLLKLMRTRYLKVLETIKQGRFDEAIKQEVRTIVEDAKTEFAPT